jgi:hypothetical protein
VDTRAALVVEVTGSRRGHPVFLGPASVGPDGYDLAYDKRNAPRRSTARQASQLALIAVWRALNLPEKPNQPLQQDGRWRRGPRLDQRSLRPVSAANVMIEFNRYEPLTATIQDNVLAATNGNPVVPLIIDILHRKPVIDKHG